MIRVLTKSFFALALLSATAFTSSAFAMDHNLHPSGYSEQRHDQQAIQPTVNAQVNDGHFDGRDYSTAQRSSNNGQWNHNDGHHDNGYQEYHRPQTKIVYVYPRYYPRAQYNHYYYPSYVNDPDYIIYSQSYRRPYEVGGYLPEEVQWYRMDDYVRYGLPSPRRGQHWVYHDRDAVLITDATYRIVSGILLAASID